MELIMLISTVIIALGAITAIISYFRADYVKKRVAYTILLNQINDIEKTIENLKIQTEKRDLRNIVLYDILDYAHTAWDDNKHLLIRKLSDKDCEMIASFFNCAKYIHNAKKDTIMLLKKHWDAKTVQVQTLIVHDILNNNNSKDMARYYDQYISTDSVFTPDIPISSLVLNVRLFSKLSGTTTYEKLRRKSYVGSK